MSGSQQKKLRQQQRAEGTEKHLVAQKKAEKKAKTHKIRTAIISVVAVIVIVAVFLVTSSFFNTNFSAVTIGEHSFTAAEYSFFYRSEYFQFVNNYGDYLEMFGLDTTKPLSAQKFGEDQTWEEYFKEAALSSMANTVMACDEAEKAGFKLTEEQQASLDESLEGLKTSNSGSDFPTADKFLAANYGKGLDVKTVGKLIEMSTIAQAYLSEKNASFTYTDAQLLDYYTANKDTLDSFTYVSYYADGAENTEDGIDSKTAMEKAKKDADALVKDADTAAKFKATATALSGSEVSESTTAGSELSSVYADWLRDSSRKEGDKTVIESETGYYALYYISHEDNNYPTKNVRHILIKAVASDDGTYSDEAKETAKEKAEELLAKWEAGEKTEDSFAKLAMENTEDTGSKEKGGLYENVYKGRMVKEFNGWLFDETHKKGDTGIVYNESTEYCGYHVMYYVGEGRNYRLVLAEPKLRNEDFSKWREEAIKAYTPTTGFTATFVG